VAVSEGLTATILGFPMDLPHSLTDRYELTTHLARGGMADVYRGRDDLLGRQVAIKVLHSQFSSDEAFVKRFRREAQAAANLTHPNIVGIYDWGQVDSTYFIVMELVEGRSLRDVLRSEGALLPRRATEIASEVAAALTVAHRAGVVHRDVKPGNILLAPDGTVKVTDFGIARAWDDSQELTRTGAVIGTATYFSPEQAQGEAADGRSDVYSLGVVLYEMLAGRPPFSGDSPVAVAFQHVSTQVTPPSALNPDVPGPLGRGGDAGPPEGPGYAIPVCRRHAGRPPAGAERRGTGVRAAGHRRGRRGGRRRGRRPDPDDAPGTTSDGPARRGVPRDRGAGPSNVPFILGVFALLVTLGILLFFTLRLLNFGGSDTELVVIPDVTGFAESDALTTLQQENLVVTLVREASEEVEEGLVIRTEPPAGTEVEPRSTVQLVVSAGEETFAVPPLIGLTQEDAEDLIREAEFTVGTVTLDETSDREPGTVIAQNPLPGIQAPVGSPIDLVVAAGAESVLLPDLSGFTASEVFARLAALGLTWEEQTEFSDTVQRGRVIRTEPPADTEVPVPSNVIVVVSDGVEPVPVPDLFGQTRNEAEAELRALGLVLRVAATTIEVQDPDLDGRVVAQVPEGGVVVPKGTTVNVSLGVYVPPTTTTTAPPETTTTTAAP
jgi:eukaryotic-like serine/threonine-protein kinase